MYNSTNLPLEKRKIYKKTLESLAFLSVILLFGGILMIFNYLEPELNMWWAPVLVFGIAFLSIIGTYIYQIFYYKFYYYNFKEDGAEIKKGVISQSTGHVRYERIQNIFVDQDILDRFFRLYDVHYETAGETSGTYSHVDGLNKENSEKLVDFLNNKLFRKDNITKQSITKSQVSSNYQTTSKSTGEVIDRMVAPISSRIIIKDSISQTLYVVFLIFFIGTVFFGENSDITISTPTVFSVATLIIIISLISSLIYQKIWFKNFYFQFSDNSGLIRSQVIALSSSYVYYDKIQNINVTQGLLERIFGLFSVTIETAAESSNKDEKAGLQIPGLTKSDAEKIKNFLLTKVDQFKNKL